MIGISAPKFLLTFLSTAVRLTSSILLLILLARTVELEVFSAITVGLLIGQLSSIIIDAGVNNSVLRYAGIESFSEHSERVIAGAIIRLVMAIQFSIFVFGVTIIVESLYYGQLVFLSALSGMLAAISDTFFIGLRAKRRFFSEFFHSTVMLLLIFLSSLIFVFSERLSGLALVGLRIFSFLGLVLYYGMSGKNSKFTLPSWNKIFSHYRNLRHYFRLVS